MEATKLTETTVETCSNCSTTLTWYEYGSSSGYFKICVGDLCRTDVAFKIVNPENHRCIDSCESGKYMKVFDQTTDDYCLPSDYSCNTDKEYPEIDKTEYC